MPKKRAKRKASTTKKTVTTITEEKKRKKKSPAKKAKAPAAGKLEKQVLENLIALQKVYTSTAEKFDRLSRQISSLLTLFENAARAFAEQPAAKSTEKDKEFLDKINKLLDQNKTIARGLTLMGDKVKEDVYGSSMEEHPTPHDISEMPNIPLPPGRRMPMQHPEQQSSQEAQPSPQQFRQQSQFTPATSEEEFKPSISGRPLPKY